VYLGTHLVRGRKKLMAREDIAQCKAGDKGPDIGIRKGKRVIWIEAIARLQVRPNATSLSSRGCGSFDALIF
jgi:hypothetical protein